MRMESTVQPKTVVEGNAMRTTTLSAMAMSTLPQNGIWLDQIAADAYLNHPRTRDQGRTRRVANFLQPHHQVFAVSGKHEWPATKTTNKKGKIK